MGVKLPDSGVAKVVAVGVAVGVGILVAVGEAVGVPVGVAVGVRVAEGVASKAGPSAASTTKVLVKVLKIPEISVHLIVILWLPSGRSVGGVQLHSPEEGTFTCSVMGSDSSVMVNVVPGGASPKNSGWVVDTVSPWATLSRVTVVAEGVEIFSPTSNPEEGVAVSGSSTDALGTSLVSLGGKFLKSWVEPKTIEGTGFADWGYIWAVATPSPPALTEISKRVLALSTVTKEVKSFVLAVEIEITQLPFWEVIVESGLEPPTVR